MIASPCTKLCTLDPDRRWCLGCGRTVGEIGAWSGTDDATRRAIVVEAAARLRRTTDS